jgi:CubicO group peptidase (beta-lactamase class C family)
MTLPRSIRLIAVLLFVLVVFPTTRSQEAPLTGFDDYVNKALRDWQVPGLAIAIVKNDQVVFAKGYGVRKLGDPAMVFLAAEQLIARVSGKSWDEFIRQRIFIPLSMTASNTSIRDLKKSDNVSSPHAKLEDKVEVIPWRNIDNIAPAGAINSNAVDMAQWVRLQLGQGTYQNHDL